LDGASANRWSRGKVLQISMGRTQMKDPASDARLPFALVLSFLAAQASAADSLASLDIETHAIVQRGIYQHAVSDAGESISNRTRAAAIVDVGFDYRPSARNQFRTLLRWADGNALNNTPGLVLSPYGGDVEDDVRNINGHERDYVLEAWFRHDVEPAPDSLLDITAGLVDASNYIDLNAFAGDENSQFMNAAFVLNNLASIPAYDPGVAVELQSGGWSLNAVTMRTWDEDAGGYGYYAAELGFNSQRAIGDGNYRVFAFSTTDDFEDPNKAKSKPLRGGGVSIDQYLADWLGVFARFGYQNHVAPDYERLFSAGFHLNGSVWSRPADSAGIGIARLDGEDHSTLSHTDVLEVYARFVMSEQVDISFDVQYMKDRRENLSASPRLIAVGTRLNLGF
jgi:porin